MTEESSAMTLRAIGTVKNQYKQPPGRSDWWTELVSEIVIEPELIEALDGLDDFSHIIVIFWIHRPEREVQLRIHPMGRRDIPLTGLFATRTPARPNRIGLTVVRLLDLRDNILKVQGLDALDESPVIDIKPYIPIADMVNDAEVPGWIINR